MNPAGLAAVEAAKTDGRWDASDEHHVAAMALQAKLIRQARGFVTTDRHFRQARFTPLLRR